LKAFIEKYVIEMIQLMQRLSNGIFLDRTIKFLASSDEGTEIKMGKLYQSVKIKYFL
jgi:hypothetical protein